MKVFKYHVRAYYLYKKFNKSVFYGKDANIIGVRDMHLTYLLKKGIIKNCNKRAKDECSDYDGRRYYRCFSVNGLKLMKYFEDNEHLIAKIVLQDEGIIQ